MENYQRTTYQTTFRARIKTILFSCVLTLLLASCGISYNIHDPTSSLHPIAPLAKEIVLQVDDTGLRWGTGQVGEVVKNHLINNEVFEKVNYPIFPRYKGPIKIQILAQGDIDEDGIGVLKAILTGLLFLLPVGIIQYEDTFVIEADIKVTQEGRVVGSFKIKSEVDANHTLFSRAHQYTVGAQKLVLEEFAKRISVELNHHPEWFPR